jgi:hypothetical protein
LDPTQQVLKEDPPKPSKKVRRGLQAQVIKFLREGYPRGGVVTTEDMRVAFPGYGESSYPGTLGTLAKRDDFPLFRIAKDVYRWDPSLLDPTTTTRTFEVVRDLRDGAILLLDPDTEDLYVARPAGK